jgi:RimJ/RimL family protein N-acetyltransferase
MQKLEGCLLDAKAEGCLPDAKAGGFAYFVVCMLLLQETIYTERLVLRPFTLADARQVKALAGERQIYETTLFVPYPYEDGMAESWISTHQAGFYEGRGVVFAICLASGALMGAIALNKAGLFNSAELGYWIGVAYWNRGYCTEAAKAVLEYGFNVLRYHKISARHFVGNNSSGRVMEKIGMRHEGLLQDDVMKDGKYISVELYGIVNAREAGA